MAAYLSPPPQTFEVDHPRGRVLVVGVQRAPRLVPLAADGKMVYWLRIGDQSVQAPDYLVSDLVLVLDGELGLRHRRDHIYKSTCILFDQKKRQCSVHEARPQTCRDYPLGSRCGYYDFLKFERGLQRDESFVPDA